MKNSTMTITSGGNSEGEIGKLKREQAPCHQRWHTNCFVRAFDLNELDRT